jgi:hypothetical protein
MPESLQREAAASVSPWHPLRLAIFRNLLVADLLSDIGAFMQTVGAAWLMTTLTKSSLYIALIQTASALPFFLLALPAGSIGDIFDRRKLILVTEAWMLAVATVLTILTFTGTMGPWLLLLQFTFPLPDTAIDLSTWNHWGKPSMFEEHAADLGPVLVTVRYVIDPAKAQAFLNDIYQYQRIRRRDGATRWGVYFDTESPQAYLETFLVDSWLEHERQHDRFTVSDHELEKRVLSYTVEKAVVKHYIHAQRTKHP